MTEISNNQLITINRGDTLDFPLIINVCNQLTPRKYKLKPGDAVYFGVMEANQSFEEALIRKKYTNADLDIHDCVIIKLDVNDTINLVPGVYYYEVKLERAATQSGENDLVRTIIGKRKFMIVE